MLQRQKKSEVIGHDSSETSHTQAPLAYKNLPVDSVLIFFTGAICVFLPIALLENIKPVKD